MMETSKKYMHCYDGNKQKVHALLWWKQAKSTCTVMMETSKKYMHCYDGNKQKVHALLWWKQAKSTCTVMMETSKKYMHCYDGNKQSSHLQRRIFLLPQKYKPSWERISASSFCLKNSFSDRVSVIASSGFTATSTRDSVVATAHCLVQGEWLLPGFNFYVILWSYGCHTYAEGMLPVELCFLTSGSS